MLHQTNQPSILATVAVIIKNGIFYIIGWICAPVPVILLVLCPQLKTPLYTDPVLKQKKPVVLCAGANIISQYITGKQIHIWMAWSEKSILFLLVDIWKNIAPFLK